jgi:ubiquinone/menaquinone biosynthesis C-methylase UbiE
MSQPLPDRSLDASSIPERFDPATMPASMIEAEHLARYRWVSSLAAGRRVLDAGCGTAYGSRLLADAGATEVVGVDLDEDLLNSVRPSMPSSVILETADVNKLPYDRARFDLVVCFEVLEHLGDVGTALDELRRVLAPEGLIAASTPNRHTYPPGNPHHVREFTPDEFEELLQSRFTNVRLERQHTWITSGVLEDVDLPAAGGGDLVCRPSVHKLVQDRPGSELYTVALAGGGDLPSLSSTFELVAPVELRKWNSLWQEQDDTLKRQAEILARQEQALAKHAIYRAQWELEVTELRNQLATAEADVSRGARLETQIEELVQLNGELIAYNDELIDRDEGLDELVAIAERYTVLVHSTSWRLTGPFRTLARLLRNMRR